MHDQALDSLTDNQRACLLLVLGGATSKEIAPLLGLTFRTVDQYLHEAQQTLGAPARREAARSFASRIDEAELKRLQLKFPTLAQSVSLPAVSPPPAAPPRRGQGWQRLLVSLRPPPLGGQVHDLKWTGKLSEMLRATIYMAAIMSGLVLLLAGILALLR